MPSAHKDPIRYVEFEAGTVRSTCEKFTHNVHYAALAFHLVIPAPTTISKPSKTVLKSIFVGTLSLSLIQAAINAREFFGEAKGLSGVYGG